MNIRVLITRLKSHLRKYPGYGLVRFAYHLLQGLESRNAALILLRPPQKLFQPYGTTSYDRFPEIFQLVRERIGDGPNVRILSFGCSTGKKFFPCAAIFLRQTSLGSTSIHSILRSADSAASRPEIKE